MTSSAPSVRQVTPAASLLLLLAAGAWIGVVVVARHMGSMPGTMGLGVGSFAAVWVLMMIAMMLPSVTPFASLYMRTFTEGRGVRLAAFVVGYLLVWSVSVIPAYWLAWTSDRFVGHHPSAATALAVIIFGGCGIYQLSPVKDRCLARCRSPLGYFFKFGSYKGRTRDVRVGLVHGAFCFACCWALMALLIAFGLMNLLAMVVLAAIVLLEKAVSWGTAFSRLLGVVSLVLAVVVIFEPRVAPGLQPVLHARMGQM